MPKKKTIQQLEDEYWLAYESSFNFIRMQVKSIEKLKRFAEILKELDYEYWIRSINYKFESCFFCPDINIEQLNKDDVYENLLYQIISELREKEIASYSNWIMTYPKICNKL